VFLAANMPHHTGHIKARARSTFRVVCQALLRKLNLRVKNPSVMVPKINILLALKIPFLALVTATIL